MKKIILYFFLLFPGILAAQIENVIVEQYYIADANDATDTIGGGIEEGSVTYRVYIDLAPKCKLVKIYGDQNHTLYFKSTLPFFNNIDRGRTFGYQISGKKLHENTVALDTWITIGQASNKHVGVEKIYDTDSSIVGGIYNDGGSEEISGGLLTNANDSILNITDKDGLIETNAQYNYFDYGFKDIITNEDSTIFSHVKKTNEFISNEAVLLVSEGVSGFTQAENHVLIAQLTTKGKLSFELNLEVMLEDGSLIKYVSQDSILLEGEKLSPYLKYPFECGCSNPNYLEYNEKYACNDESQCKTLIVLGCMDEYACNYNKNANIHMQDLCCYPGFCNNRDITVVCDNYLEIQTGSALKLFPNPAVEYIQINQSLLENKNTYYAIFNIYGDFMFEGILPNGQNIIQISSLETGLYILQLETKEGKTSIKFSKD